MINCSSSAQQQRTNVSKDIEEAAETRKKEIATLSAINSCSSLHGDFLFRPLALADIPSVVRIATHEFLEDEPHCRALGLHAENAGQLVEYIVRRCCHYAFSVVTTLRSTGQIVAFRLMSIGHRSPSDDVIPFHPVVSSSNALVLCAMNQQLENNFWTNQKASTLKILRHELTFVSAGHRRRGIASHLLHLGLHFNQLKALGITGILVNASTNEMQSLLERAGYRCAAEATTRSVDTPWCRLLNDPTMPTNTDSLKLMYIAIKES